jgi:hypothetical protein
VSGAWTDEEAQVTGNRRSPYIPLLVKLPHSRAGRAYEQPVSMLVLHDLVLALARGEIRTNDDLASWLDQHRGRFPLPQGLTHARP